MFKRNHLYLLILFILCFFSRVLTSIYYIEDIDSLRFAFSLYDYDITKLQPHFPGYPVFCFIAKIIYLVTGSMGITFSIIGGVSIFFIIYYLLKFDNNEIGSFVGLFLIFVIFFNPLIWLMSNRYMPDIMGLALVVAILYQLIVRSNNTPLLYCGYFLSGILAGIRLSYLPLIAIPFISGIIKNDKKFKLITLFLSGIILWLIPLIWITGFENLWSSALNHAYGHFTDYGGSIFTEKNWIIRLLHIVESVWADGLGGYWIGRSWVTGIFSFILFALLMFGYRTIINNWRYEKTIKILIYCVLIYLLWIFFSQNIVYKSRHILPVLILFFMILKIGFKYVLTKRSTKLNIVVILFVILLTQITTTLVFDHRNPSAISQLKDYLLKQKNVPTILGTPLINYYLKSNQVKTNYINIDDNFSLEKYLIDKNNDEILMIGNFKSLFMNSFFIEQKKSFYHNPYINRMWSQIDTYYLIHKNQKK